MFYTSLFLLCVFMACEGLDLTA